MTFLYRFESETKPITPPKLAVETNTREQFCVLGPRRTRFQVDSPWHSGAADVLTYEPEELLGTKLRALYQRKKGGDLFDLSEALTRIIGLDAETVVACFTRYLENDGRRVTRTEFEAAQATLTRVPAKRAWTRRPWATRPRATRPSSSTTKACCANSKTGMSSRESCA